MPLNDFADFLRPAYLCIVSLEKIPSHSIAEIGCERNMAAECGCLGVTPTIHNVHIYLMESSEL
jgi:hypothetical protein